MYLRKLLLSSLFLLLLNVTSAQLSASFQSSDTLGCAPHACYFTSASSGATSFLWDFGNGTSSNVQHPVVLYNVAGNYTVTLTVADTAGGTFTISHPNFVVVESNPIAGFSTLTSNNCQNGTTVDFTNTSSPGLVYYDFGDGNQSSTVNPNHTYTSAGAYFPVVILTSPGGCVDTYISTSPITVAPSVVPSLSISDSVACDSTQLFTYINTSASSSATAWDFGDGTGSNAPTTSHQYNASGVYTVTLVNTDVNGCVDSVVWADCITVLCPTANTITCSSPQCCVPAQLSYSNNGTGLTQTTWVFTDNLNDTLVGNSINRTFSQVGTYDLIVTSNYLGGCSFTDTVGNIVTVNPAPQVAIGAVNLNSCAPDTLFFEPLFYDSTASYAWDFGNGQTSNIHFTNSMYAAAGTYNATLTITDSSGCSAQANHGPIVFSNSLVDFTANVLYGCGPLAVQFTDLSVNVQSWQWDFGDGTTSNLEHPSHVYQFPGLYDVRLITFNGSGCTDTLLVSSYIEVENAIPAIVSNQTFVGCQPYSVNFDGSLFGNTSWLWNFGDGVTSNLPSPSHTYTSAGLYNVSVTTYNAQGCAFTFQTFASVEVIGPAIDFSAQQLACTPLIVSFTDLTPNSYSWNWNFGNGTLATNQHPTAYYSAPGVYAVSLQAESTNGCSYTLVKLIAVSDSCVNNSPVNGNPVFGTGMGSGPPGMTIPDTVLVASNTGCIPHLTQFIHFSDTAVSHYWDFGDGATSNDMDPWHSYNQEGVFDVTYISTYANGSQDTIFVPALFDLFGETAQITSSSTFVCDSLLVNFESLNTAFDSAYWTFPNSSSVSGLTASEVFELSDTLYTVIFTLVDTNLCVSSTSVVIPAFATDYQFVFDSVVCLGDTLFVDLSLTNGSTVTYDFGDGTPVTVNGKHLYNAPGFYSINAWFTDVDGCVIARIVTDSMEVFTPDAGFSALDPTEGCADHTVQFQPFNPNADSYYWELDSLAVSSNFAPTHTFTNEGLYDITLTVTERGCTATSVQVEYVEVHEAQAHFSYTVNGLCLPFTANFTDQSQAAVSWFWDFGDGTTSTVANPIKIFSSAPTQPVTLTITDVNGCIASHSESMPGVYSADFTSDVQLGCAPLLVNFSDNSAQTVAWFWDFGDGGTSTLQTPAHVYNSAGNYTVTLVATTSSGCTDTATFINYISVGSLEAGFDYSATISCAPVVAVFQDQSVNADSLVWNFGDGSGSTLNTPVHVYTQPGTYFIELTAYNHYGCIDTFVHLIPVSVLGPVADFAVSDTSLCLGDSLQLTNLSTNGAEYHWFFGDGQGDSTFNSGNVYAAQGAYQLTLLVIDSTGCANVFDYPSLVHVSDYPTAQFNATNFEGCEALEVDLDNYSTNATSYLWDFGNGQLSTGNPQSYTYNGDGVFDITLYAANDFGCLDTALFQSVIVYPQSDAQILGPIQLCTDDGIVSLTATTSNGVWSGALHIDSITGVVDPTLNGQGAYQVYYAIDGDCPDIDSAFVTIDATPNASITPVPSTCVNSAQIQLHGADSGGVWSGVGIVDSLLGLFDPTIAGVGHHPVYYDFYFPCASRDSLDIVVHELPDFNIVATALEGCPNLPVTFSIATNDSLFNIQWSMDTLTLLDDSLFHVSLPSGYYTPVLSATNQYGCTAVDSIVNMINVYSSEAPAPLNVKRVSVVSEQEVLMEWDATQVADFERYVIYRQNLQTGAFDTIATIYQQATSQFVDSGLNTLLNSYCYRIQAIDQCGFAQELGNLETHCTVNIDAIVAGHTALVSWSPYVGALPGNYELYRVGDGDSILSAVLSPSTLLYEDTTLHCGGEYTYHVIAKKLDGELLWSNSDYATVQSFGAPAALFSSDVILATVIDNEYTQVTWNEPALFMELLHYNLWRSVDGENYELHDIVANNSTQFSDFDLDVQAHQYTYKLEAVNTCAVSTEEALPGSSILLALETQSSQFAAVAWTRYNLWEEGVQRYELQLERPNGTWLTLIETSDSVLATELNLHADEFLEGQSVLRIQAFCNNGVQVSTSNEIELWAESQLFIPNAFSPDDDAHNDLFELKGFNITDFTLLIYNRWGELVFTSSELSNSWNGSYKGVEAPVDSYVYHVTARDSESQSLIKRTGILALVR
jgi:gliding motility-associated-like protein